MSKPSHKTAKKHSIKSFTKPDILLVGIFISVLSLAVVAFLLVSGLLKKPELKTSEYQIGQTARIEGVYEITVDSEKNDAEMAKLMHLPGDQTLRVVHAKITNLSSEPLNYLPALQSYMRNDQGDTYTIFADVSQPALPPKILQKNESIEGNLAFVTSSSNSPMWIYFDTHFKQQSPVIFKINQ